MTARPLAPGDVIHGFAYGAFGRDHYDCVCIEAVGRDWIVARNERTGGICVLAGEQELRLGQQARDEPCPYETGILADEGFTCPYGTRASQPATEPLTTWRQT